MYVQPAVPVGSGHNTLSSSAYGNSSSSLSNSPYSGNIVSSSYDPRGLSQLSLLQGVQKIVVFSHINQFDAVINMFSSFQPWIRPVTPFQRTDKAKVVHLLSTKLTKLPKPVCFLRTFWWQSSTIWYCRPRWMQFIHLPFTCWVYGFGIDTALFFLWKSNFR